MDKTKGNRPVKALEYQVWTLDPRKRNQMNFVENLCGMQDSGK